MTSNGVHDATDNFDTFCRLVGDTASFNIGVATGTASNVIGEWLRHEVDGHFWCWMGTHWVRPSRQDLEEKDH
jgi:hypothetical protein